jgi:hypothetical protein
MNKRPVFLRWENPEFKTRKNYPNFLGFNDDFDEDNLPNQIDQEDAMLKNHFTALDSVHGSSNDRGYLFLENRDRSTGTGRDGSAVTDFDILHKTKTPTNGAARSIENATITENITDHINVFNGITNSIINPKFTSDTTSSYVYPTYYETVSDYSSYGWLEDEANATTSFGITTRAARDVTQNISATFNKVIIPSDEPGSQFGLRTGVGYVPPHYVQIRFPTKIQLKSYKLWHQGSRGYPSDWTVRGSNEGTPYHSPAGRFQIQTASSGSITSFLLGGTELIPVSTPVAWAGSEHDTIVALRDAIYTDAVFDADEWAFTLNTINNSKLLYIWSKRTDGANDGTTVAVTHSLAGAGLNVITQDVGTFIAYQAESSDWTTVDTQTSQDLITGIDNTNGEAISYNISYNYGDDEGYQFYELFITGTANALAEGDHDPAKGMEDFILVEWEMSGNRVAMDIMNQNILVAPRLNYSKYEGYKWMEFERAVRYSLFHLHNIQFIFSKKNHHVREVALDLSSILDIAPVHRQNQDFLVFQFDGKKISNTFHFKQLPIGRFQEQKRLEWGIRSVKYYPDKGHPSFGLTKGSRSVWNNKGSTDSVINTWSFPDMLTASTFTGDLTDYGFLESGTSSNTEIQHDIGGNLGIFTGGASGIELRDGTNSELEFDVDAGDTYDFNFILNSGGTGGDKVITGIPSQLSITCHTNTTKTPTDWVLSGVDVDDNIDTLHTQVAPLTWSSEETKTFAISTTTHYKEFRIKFSGTNDAVTSRYILQDIQITGTTQTVNTEQLIAQEEPKGELLVVNINGHITKTRNK